MSDLTDAAASDAFDTDDLESLRSDAADAAMDAMAERMEKELYGAWRAGFAYVHVYDALTHNGLRMDTFSIRQYILPSHTERPPKHPSGAYRYTYDLTELPTAVMREAFQESELPEEYTDE